jgi:hypothetical protein
MNELDDLAFVLMPSSLPSGSSPCALPYLCMRRSQLALSIMDKRNIITLGARSSRDMTLSYDLDPFYEKPPPPPPPPTKPPAAPAPESKIQSSMRPHSQGTIKMRSRKYADGKYSSIPKRHRP